MANFSRCLFTAVVTTAIAMAFAQPARADVIVTVGNIGALDDDNVLLNCGNTGNAIYGALSTNNGSFEVRFSGNELLATPAQGQARVTALDGGFTYLMVDLIDASFTSLIVNIDASVDGTVDFRVFDTGGTLFSFNNQAVKGAGGNFYTFTTEDGQRIAWIDFTAGVPLTFVDAAQFRIGGAVRTATVTATVPEPAVIFLLGGGVAALVVRRRRKAN